MIIRFLMTDLRIACDQHYEASQAHDKAPIRIWTVIFDKKKQSARALLIKRENQRTGCVDWFTVVLSRIAHDRNTEDLGFQAKALTWCAMPARTAVMQRARSLFHFISHLARSANKPGVSPMRRVRRFPLALSRST
jgi:hypothetical protein